MAAPANKPLNGVVVKFSGIYSSLFKLRNGVQSLGGEVCSVFSSNVTHLVTREDSMNITDVSKAEKYGCYIVSLNWIDDCLAQSARAPESSYFLSEMKQPDSDPVKPKAQEDISEVQSSSWPATALRLSQPESSPFKLGGLLEPPSPASPFNLGGFLEESKEQDNRASGSRLFDEDYEDDLYEEEDQDEDEDDGTFLAPVPVSEEKAPKIIDTKGLKVKARELPYSQNLKNQNYDILHNVVLQLTNIKSFGAGNNKYYALELHEVHASSGSQYRVFTHYGRTCDLEKNPQAGKRGIRILPNKNDAMICWQNLLDEKYKKGYRPVELVACNVGSEKAQQQAQKPTTALPSLQQNHPDLPAGIQSFVEFIYNEAETTLTTLANVTITPHGLKTPLGVLSLAQVSKGELILDQIDQQLKSPVKSLSELRKLSSTFYSLIPCRLGRSNPAESVIDSNSKLEEKYELLQLMKDLLSVNQNNHCLQTSAAFMKYSALNCKIEVVDKSSGLWNELVCFILAAQDKDKPGAEISNIYSITRLSETRGFTEAMNNQHLLFHGSRPSNFVGLLSRGLLMPKVVVSRGGSRTDAGMLGNGLYFTDSFSTVSKYAHPGSTGNSLALINRVALGRIHEYEVTQIGRNEPPSGYDSVHGVKRDFRHAASAFVDDEFVVYDVNQQCQQFVVEFKRGAAPNPTNRTYSGPLKPLDTAYLKNAREGKNALGATVPTVTVVPKTSFQAPKTSFQATSFSTSLSSWDEPQTSSTSLSFEEPSRREEPSRISATSPSTSYLSDFDERNFRKLFVDNRSDPKLKNPHLNLRNIHAEQDFAYTSLSDSKHMILDKYRVNDSDAIGNPTVQYHDFLSRWNSFTQNVFNSMNWENTIVAGGSVLACLLNPSFAVGGGGNIPLNFEDSDIDIFLYGLSPEAANEKVKEIYRVVCNNSTNVSQVGIIRTQHALTFLGQYPFHHVQVILRIYKSPAEVLMGFDVDCCSVAYDGKTVWALPRAMRAISTRCNAVDLSRRSLTYEHRLHKYSKRGFGVLLPQQYSPSRVGRNLFYQKISEVKGVAKLLIYDNIQKTGMAPSDRHIADKSTFETRRDEEDSDYSNVFIPWGPQWFTEALIAMLNRQEKKHIFTLNKAASTNAPQTHIFVSGLDGVLSGRPSDCWCTVCKSGQLPQPDTSVQGPLKWMIDNPGKQILTGSFHPVSDSEWWNDAYKSWDDHGRKMVSVVSRQKKRVPAPMKAPKMRASNVPSQRVFFGKNKPKKAAVFESKEAARAARFGVPVTSSPSKGFSYTASPAAAPQQQQSMRPQFSTAFSPDQGSTWSHMNRTENLSDVVKQPVSQPSFDRLTSGTVAPNSEVSKLLLLVAKLYRDRLLTVDERSTIKSLIIKGDPTVLSVLEVFEVDHDFAELADSLVRICQLRA